MAHRGLYEYWAMLGKAVEASGLTMRQVQAVMELVTETASSQAQALLGQFIEFDRSGGLADAALLHDTESVSPGPHQLVAVAKARESRYCTSSYLLGQGSSWGRANSPWH